MLRGKPAFGEGALRSDDAAGWLSVRVAGLSHFERLSSRNCPRISGVFATVAGKPVRRPRQHRVSGHSGQLKWMVPLNVLGGCIDDFWPGAMARIHVDDGIATVVGTYMAAKGGKPRRGWIGRFSVEDGSQVCKSKRP